MASAEATEVFNCTCEQFFDIVSDYEKYPEFLPEVRSCSVVKQEPDRKLVEFRVNVIKDFTYSLWMRENRPHKITWELASGGVFKESSGSWTLSEEAGKCRAAYSIQAKFGVFVPGPVARALVQVNLPTMMSSYHKRVGELYGAK